MNNGGELVGMLIMYFIFIGVGILITALIMRAIFRIPTIVRNLEEQTRLLNEIVKHQNRSRID